MLLALSALLHLRFHIEVIPPCPHLRPSPFSVEAHHDLLAFLDLAGLLLEELPRQSYQRPYKKQPIKQKLKNSKTVDK